MLVVEEAMTIVYIQRVGLEYGAAAPGQGWSWSSWALPLDYRFLMWHTTKGVPVQASINQA